MAELAPLPLRTQVIDETGVMLRPWWKWLLDVKDRLDASAHRDGSVSKTTQGAAIGSTSIALPDANAGRFKVTTYARITRAATTSSSLTVTIEFTDGGVNCEFPGAAMTGNATDTVQSNTYMIDRDAASAIGYKTAYSSTGATPMQYRLEITVERVE